MLLKILLQMPAESHRVLSRVADWVGPSNVVSTWILHTTDRCSRSEIGIGSETGMREKTEGRGCSQAREQGRGGGGSGGKVSCA